MSFKEKRIKIIHENPRFKVQEICFELEDGSERNFYRVTKLNACVIIVHTKGEILLLKANRPHDTKSSYELPGGRIESSESSQTAAIRELYEETGIKVNKVTELTTTLPLPSVADEKVFIFATDIDPKPEIMIDNDAKNEGVVSGVFFNFDTVKKVIRDGRITCSIDAFALYYFMNIMEEKGDYENTNN